MLSEGFTPDAVINGPFNNVATAADAASRSRAGTFGYKYLYTSVEYAAPRRDDEVVFMGEETYEPTAEAMHAGRPCAGATPICIERCEGNGCSA